MKIIIRSKKRPKRISFWLPNSLFTSRIGLKLFARNLKLPIDQTKAKRAELKRALKIIKKFTKLNRHLNIVEIHNSEEDVIISF